MRDILVGVDDPFLVHSACEKEDEGDESDGEKGFEERVEEMKLRGVACVFERHQDRGGIEATSRGGVGRQDAAPEVVEKDCGFRVKTVAGRPNSYPDV